MKHVLVGEDYHVLQDFFACRSDDLCMQDDFSFVLMESRWGRLHWCSILIPQNQQNQYSGVIRVFKLQIHLLIVPVRTLWLKANQWRSVSQMICIRWISLCIRWIQMKEGYIDTRFYSMKNQQYEYSEVIKVCKDAVPSICVGSFFIGLPFYVKLISDDQSVRSSAQDGFLFCIR